MQWMMLVIPLSGSFHPQEAQIPKIWATMKNMTVFKDDNTAKNLYERKKRDDDLLKNR